jgi:hypothetical protein
VAVTAEGGVRGEDEACLEIVDSPGGLSVSIRDQRDPIAVGAQGSYNIQVTNTAGAVDQNLALIVTLPDELAAVETGTTGPTAFSIEGQQIVFDPVAEIPAGESVTFRVQVRAEVAGTVTVRADAVSAAVPQPQLAEETTTVLPQ